MGQKFPSLGQWLKTAEVLSNKEKRLFVFLFAVFLLSSLYLAVNFYIKNTAVVPAFGGTYKEGVIGQPRFINPIYLGTSDADRDLVEIIFSGLMKYGSDGKVVNDLAKELRVSEDGKTYEIYLKENLLWHDLVPLTADDVIFTIETIQNPDYKSSLRANWLGVKIEKIENSKNLGLKFVLEKPYAAFLERLTVKIIPRHIWQEISPNGFSLSIYNLKPIGSGPYRFKEMEQNSGGAITSIKLSGFSQYLTQSPPKIPNVQFLFFENEDNLISAANSGKVQGLALSSPKNLEKINNGKFKKYSLEFPRYFAAFFNPAKSKLLSDINIRKALNYATNKEEIVKEALFNEGAVALSPALISQIEDPYPFDENLAISLFKKSGFEKDGDVLAKAAENLSFDFKSELELGSKGKEVEALQKCLSQDAGVYPEGKITGYFGSQTKTAVIKFQEKYYKDVLEPWGFKEGTGTISKTTRSKLNEICNKPKEKELLKLTLVTSNDPLLAQTAELLKKQWQKLGIQLETQLYPISQLEKEFIKPRNYEILLLGEALGTIPDLFPYWHSSQKKDPGLNLANYESKQADKLLEEIRTTVKDDSRSKKYEELQKIIPLDAPAIFLYSPNYIYLVSKKIKGVENPIIVDPSKRLGGIENWHIKTKRLWQP
ncbi:MAG: peptidoglycan-binding protein [Candidatus Nealsonbacteria bacterium]|nr:peptidoglycan-binding protein [Candidatus Nealsonbacteria bacterium]